MPVSQRPYCLDVTRLVARAWTGRQFTGLDRVAQAYLKHFRKHALLVVQHRGIVRVFDEAHSERLSEILLAPSVKSRAPLVVFAAKALISGLADLGEKGRTYINVGHTDFDLSAHHEWLVRNRLRTVYFIHDLIPIRHPEMTSAHAVKRHRARIEMALQHGNRMIVSSHHVASDLRAFALQQGLRLPPVLVAPLAVGLPQLRKAAVGSAPDQSPYFLCIATLEPRKNHQLLFENWRALVEGLGDAAPRLIIAGQKGPLTDAGLAEAMKMPAMRSKVEWIRDCADDRLVQLLQNARALLMPTLAEGYGLPLIEALQSGVPVIASDIPIFREIGQGIPLLLDPKNRVVWGEAIADFANQSGDYARQLSAMDRFNAPLWDDHFARLENWLALPESEAGDPCLSA